MPIHDRPSPNHGPRPEGTPIDMLVLHYTGMETAAAALNRLCDPAAEVSAHYMIQEDGAILQLVPEDRRAWHAGASFWRGHSDVNSRSIGIEIVNPGHEFGYRPFPEAQIAAVAALCGDLLSRHAIPARNVVGHSDVAPRRKQDPGELFPWQRLADAGIGLWPPALETDRSAAQAPDLLAEIGYETVDLAATLSAFQRRYHPRQITGAPDAETLARMVGLNHIMNREK
ncbi:MAG: N-acetylmuramoyl-L-alanine amidase [Magnetospiraceae bacterium]